MRKTIMLGGICAALACASPALAQADHLTVFAPDGTEAATVALADIGKITFDAADNLCIDLTEGEPVRLALDGVGSIKFGEGGTTAISPATQAAATICKRGSIITIGQLPRAAAVSVVSAGGHTVLTRPAFQGGEINVQSLAPGMYIIRVGKQSFKFVK